MWFVAALNARVFAPIPFVMGFQPATLTVFRGITVICTVACTGVGCVAINVEYLRIESSHKSMMARGKLNNLGVVVVIPLHMHSRHLPFTLDRIPQHQVIYNYL